jgi:hypothetical protein
MHGNKRMTTNLTLSRMRIVIHSIGLSCLGGAICLQILVFLNIFEHGYFRAIETNSTILSGEIALTGFSAAYFIYFYQREIRTYLKSFF